MFSEDVRTTCILALIILPSYLDTFQQKTQWDINLKFYLFIFLIFKNIFITLE